MKQPFALLVRGGFFLLHAAASLFIFVVIAYLLGRPILDGNVKGMEGILVGNDSPFALSLVTWFERFFPTIPLWYPFQGMGVSLFYSYPMGTTFLVILLKQLSRLSAIEVFRILSFSVFPLTAFGVYLLGALRLKNKTVGLVAGIFFLLSQASWLFQTLHGIFAQSFSLIFVAPIFLLADWVVERSIHTSQSFGDRLLFALLVIVLACTYFVHVVTGTLVTIAIVLWAVIRCWIEGKIVASMWLQKVIKPTALIITAIVLSMSLVAFWLMPFQSYSAYANKEGLNTRSVSEIQKESPRIATLLGMRMLGEGEYRYDFFFFAAPVLLFAVVGMVLGFARKQRFIITASVICLLFVTLSIIPHYLPFIASLFQFFFTTVYFRGLIPVIILLPIIAAWGVTSLVEVIFIVPVRRLVKNALRGTSVSEVITRSTLKGIAAMGVSIVSLTIAFIAIKYIQLSPPPNPQFEKSLKYKYDSYGPSLSDDFKTVLDDPKTLVRYLHPITVSKDGLNGVTQLLDYLHQFLDIDANTIIDVSPYAAGGAIMQGVGFVDNIRTINLYHYYASLIHGMWGYQAGNFFGKEPLYKSSRPFADLSDWFGIKYALLTPGFEPFYKYEAAGWAPHEKFNEFAELKSPQVNRGVLGFHVWENPHANGLISATDKKTILVITNGSKGGYDHVFRSGNLGAFTYNDAWLVHGNAYIDDYSLEELQQFSIVILHGYSYKSRSRAWSLIEKYLESGGNVFVDTGWQFVAKDWGDVDSSVSLSEPNPMVKTQWSNIGSNWNDVMIAPQLNSDIHLSTFDPPVWDGQPWGMAVGNRKDLRKDAEPILYKGDQILMARRRVGKGEIIWSGINLFSHVTYKMNETEADFVKELFKPWMSQENTLISVDTTLKRDIPDSATITLNQTVQKPLWLLFRESASPQWKAVLNTGSQTQQLHIWRGGPGFVLLRIPPTSTNASIELTYELDFKDGVIAKVVSIAAFVFLVAIVLLGNYMRLPSKIKQIQKTSTASKNEDVEY